MKKILLTVAASITMMACVNPYGPAGKNAEQFVREQIPEQKENIKSIEVVKEDSLLSDCSLGFASFDMAKAGASYAKGQLSADDYMLLLDSVQKVVNDIAMSWDFTFCNDSLSKLPKYQGILRRVYTVKVKMKSNTEKDYRVLMENDGLTPRLMEADFKEKLLECQSEIRERVSRFIYDL